MTIYRSAAEMCFEAPIVKPHSVSLSKPIDRHESQVMSGQTVALPGIAQADDQPGGIVLILRIVGLGARGPEGLEQSPQTHFPPRQPLPLRRRAASGATRGWSTLNSAFISAGLPIEIRSAS